VATRMGWTTVAMVATPVVRLAHGGGGEVVAAAPIGAAAATGGAAVGTAATGKAPVSGEMTGVSEPIRCASSSSVSSEGGPASPAVTVGPPRIRRSRYIPIERSTTPGSAGPSLRVRSWLNVASRTAGASPADRREISRATARIATTTTMRAGISRAGPSLGGNAAACRTAAECYHPLLTQPLRTEPAWTRRPFAPKAVRRTRGPRRGARGWRDRSGRNGPPGPGGSGHGSGRSAPGRKPRTRRGTHTAD